MNVFRKHNRVRVSVCEFGFVFGVFHCFVAQVAQSQSERGRDHRIRPKSKWVEFFVGFFFFLFWEYREINKSKTKETKTQNTHILAIGWGRVRVKGEVF